MKNKIGKVLAVVCKMEPTEEILDAIWPWNYPGNFVKGMVYGSHKIDLLLFTGEFRDPETGDVHDWNEAAKPGTESAIFYRTIPLQRKDVVLHVVELEDDTLWEVMTDFVPTSVGAKLCSSQDEWERKSSQKKGLKYLPKSCKKGYFLCKLEGEHLELHMKRLASIRSSL